MFRNYFNIAIRNIFKHKVFSFINIFGLAVSMSVCLLIMLIIADQKSYDQFHVNKDRIYRVHTWGKNGFNFKTASSALPLAEKLKKEYAGVEETASLVRGFGGDVFYNQKVASGGGYFADGGLFKIFDFELSKGDENTALQNPFSLIVSEEIALQLFGNEDPIGKSVKFNDKGISPTELETGNRETEYGDFMITGVMKKPAGKTHLPFKMLASLSTLLILGKEKKLEFSENNWDNVWQNYSYILLEKGKTKEDLQTALAQISEKQYPPKSPNQYDFKAEALIDLTPADLIGNLTSLSVPRVVLLVLSVLGLIVMLSACLNYTNLSVARALTRAKEVGIRKVSGASRGQVFMQFITEAVIISLFALVLSIAFLNLLKFAFTDLWLNQYLKITFNENLYIFLIFITFAVVIGIIAGVLPSIYVSAFNPIQVLKNFAGMKLFRRMTLRKVLLVVQFSISLIFIISTTLLYSQLDTILNADYGFDKENVVTIKLYRTENYQRFANVIKGNKDVLEVSGAGFLPSTGQMNGTQVFKFTENKKDSVQTYFIDIDAHFLDLMKIKLVAGKDFPENPSTESEQYIMLNETMVKNFNLGTPAEAVGQKLLIDNNNVEVIGVVKDFYYGDISRKIGAFVFRNRAKEFGYVSAKISAKNAMATVAYLESEWKKVNPNTKFEYEFLDQKMLFLYSMFSDVAKVIGFLSFLAALVSCLGLLGMATYTAETRTKEIGVRKVLGASVSQIAFLLSKGFITLLLIAIVIATPIAYFMNNLWLEFFATRVNFGVGILGLGILIMLVISLLTVFSQTWQAARANPVESLKNE